MPLVSVGMKTQIFGLFADHFYVLVFNSMVARDVGKMVIQFPMRGLVGPNMQEHILHR